MQTSMTKVAYFIIAAFFALSDRSAVAAGGTHRVKCVGNNTIQKALDKAHDGDVIHVVGNCTEHVVIEKNRITLIADPGASLSAPDNSNPAIRIRGQNVRVEGFSSISGGNQVIQVDRGGSADIVNNTIENGDRGILVTQNAYARVARNIIRDNGESGGVTVRNSAAADVDSNTITANMGIGVSVDDGASVDLDDNQITLNTGDGIRVRGTSHIRLSLNPDLGQANFIEGNLRGIRCQFNSSIRSGIAQNYGTGNTLANSLVDCSVNGPV